MRSPLPTLRRNLPIVIGGTALAVSLGLPTASAAGVNVPGYHTVTNSKIAPDAVSKSKIRHEAVGASEIIEGSVTWGNLAQSTKDRITELAKTGRYETFQIKADGHLYGTDDAGASHDLGNVVGTDGKNGADGVQGAKGDKGDSGEPGAKGDKGEPGKDGVSGYALAHTDAQTIGPDSGTVTLTVSCPENKVATGGGVSTGTGGAHVVTRASYPSMFGQGENVGIPFGWAVKVAADDTASVRAWVICASMG